MVRVRKFYTRWFSDGQLTHLTTANNMSQQFGMQNELQLSFSTYERFFKK